MLPERLSIAIALVLFASILIVTWRTACRPLAALGVLPMGLAAAALAVGIALRWTRTGQGPFLTLFEVLLSNLFSLALVLSLLYAFVPRLRAGTPFAAGLLLIVSAWALVADPEPVALPATFEHAWLWVHVTTGKLFLAFCVAAVCLAAAIAFSGGRLAAERYDPLVWRSLAVAFVFHSFMLMAGAVWAHDAWGRYWSWDPLETWTLLTWLGLAILLHLRLTVRLPARVGYLFALGVFVLAFLTFFGVPFLSNAPHKGVM